jgi:hypothetical protein
MTSNDEIYSIPTWENGSWVDNTIFNTRQEFIDFLLPIFKEPGKYEFDETTLAWNEEARLFTERGKNTGVSYYCGYKEGSRDYRVYWDNQKEKCRKGAIFKNNGKVWYLTRDYYMWINFLPINDKVKKKFAFPEVWDTQYHMALYEVLAELHYKHCAILKKRQIASSYFHAAKLINQIWFEETPILKMGSSIKDKINEKGTWRFLNEYRNFLDTNTAWYRPMNPGKVLMWQQQIEETINGRPTTIGNKGVIQGLTLEQDPTAGVGGDCRIFFYEEAGIAPTMDKTKEYLMPALSMGEITTGIFIAAGSVGELDQCKPLEMMIKHPDANDIYAVETNLIDDKGTIGRAGLFIPEQWSMPPYIDKWGNSLVQEALDALARKYEQDKKNLDPELYQLRISQRPRNIAEAFAHRSVSLFPQHLIAAQKRRIEEKTYSIEYMDIQRDAVGKIEVKPSNRLPIKTFPVDKKMEDKSGVLIVYEKPDKDAPWGTYFASIDPVSEGKTTTSESLCSIYVYKNPVEVTRIDGDKIENFIERDKIVASWCGRFDNINKTHEKLEMIIEWYNAWTIVENNISLFIQYMISKNKQKYLVPKSQIAFLKDLGSNINVFQEYGWKNTGTLFKSHLLSYLIEFLKEELDSETKPDGTIIRTTYGIERIPDAMALVEMEQYQEGLNVDRLVSLAALVSFAKIQQSNLGYKKRIEYTDKKHLEKPDNLYKLDSMPFRNIGRHGSSSGSRLPRKPFKNMR